NFLGVMNIIGGLLTFPLQLFLMNRIINRVGVSNTMLLYPLSTALSSAALLFLPPQVFNAALGVLNRSVFRLAFRAPVMGLVYNVVPSRIRGRTRAFVSGLIEPVGAVLGSLLLLAIPTLGISNLLAIALSALVATYVLGTLGTRRYYGTTLVTTLQSEEYSALFDNDDLLTVSDPQTLNRLKDQLLASTTPDNTFFMARLLAESGGKAAVPILQEVLQNQIGDSSNDHTLALQSGILNALVMTQATTPDVIALFFMFIDHSDQHMREAAIDGLEEAHSFSTDQFSHLHTRLTIETSLKLQGRLIPVLLRAPDPHYVETAHTALNTLLTGTVPAHILTGLEVVIQINHDVIRYIPVILALIHHQDDEIRLGAVRALETFIRHGTAVDLNIYQLDHLQNDPVERIRELALSIIRHTDDPEQHYLILSGLKDPSRAVRHTAVRVLIDMGDDITLMLISTVAAKKTDAMVRKLATVVLAQVQPGRHHRQIEDYIIDDLREIYQNNRQLAALVKVTNYQSSQGIRILQTTLQEQNELHLDDIFYLLTTLAPPPVVGTIREALESDVSAIKASGIEVLESLISATLVRWLSAQFDASTHDGFMTAMSEKTGIPADLSARDALNQLLIDQEDSWLRAAALYALGEIEGVFSLRERETLLKEALADPFADVRQAARAAQRRLKTNGQNPSQELQLMSMLSQIERIMFLKQVSLFQSIPLEQLKALAAVCESEVFPAKVTIFKQDEASGGLYVVTAGQVAIQVRGHATSTIQLATLGVNAYFGEMSLFNNRPRSASAVTLQETEVMKLSRTSFIRLVRQFPDMSLTLLDVLSQRLAELNEQLASQ
ncbi:MAG TPA: cyclic nucleotide-binding domain-containing protein, partial [Phototrophicaceae bacterium]|nr:cyclic nucleotide-binding domain-containing protein [Phototrophicaceae bacterium]